MLTLTLRDRGGDSKSIGRGIRASWHFFLVFQVFFCRLLIFFLNHIYRKILLGIPSECQTVWIQIRPDALLGQIWVQSVCKSCQQTALVGKELMEKRKVPISLVATTGLMLLPVLLIMIWINHYFTPCLKCSYYPTK